MPAQFLYACWRNILLASTNVPSRTLRYGNFRHKIVLGKESISRKLPLAKRQVTWANIKEQGLRNTAETDSRLSAVRQAVDTCQLWAEVRRLGATSIVDCVSERIAKWTFRSAQVQRCCLLHLSILQLPERTHYSLHCHLSGNRMVTEIDRRMKSMIHHLPATTAILIARAVTTSAEGERYLSTWCCYELYLYSCGCMCTGDGAANEADLRDKRVSRVAQSEREPAGVAMPRVPI